jgi:hypothetical protein
LFALAIFTRSESIAFVIYIHFTVVFFIPIFIVVPPIGSVLAALVGRQSGCCGKTIANYLAVRRSIEIRRGSSHVHRGREARHTVIAGLISICDLRDNTVEDRFFSLYRYDRAIAISQI